MSRLGDLVLLVRQLLANDAWVLRRAVRESMGLALGRLAPVSAGAGRLAVRVDPRAAAAHRALAEHARRRGRAEDARAHDQAAEAARRMPGDTSVLEILRSTLRRGEPAADSGAAGLAEALSEPDLGSARARLRALPLGAFARVEGLLALAARADESGDILTAAELLEEAVALDRGRAAAWRELGRARSRLQRPDAEAALSMAADLDPHDAQTWLALARLHGAPDRSRTAAKLALELDPRCDAAVRLLEPPTDPDGEVLEPPTLEPHRTSFACEVGDRVRWPVRVWLPRSGTLYVLEPPGRGLACLPRGPLGLEAGEHDVEIEIDARRPQTVGGAGPWILHLALACGPHLVRAEAAIEVPDREPGRIFHVVTEDHELYDERSRTTADDARTTLVDKSRMAESIANRVGACWTHVVDVGSLALVNWAADRSSSGAWRGVARDLETHLVDAVENGNDLGLHCHAFHDPETDVFCHGFDSESDCVTTEPEFLERSTRERGFWSRAFERIGDVDDRGSRAWATWRGIGRLESLGRLADPAFRVALFRAGSFDFGDTPENRGHSLSLLQRLDLLADSDVPKPRLYNRPPKLATYPVEADPARPASDIARMRALEMRAEYNVEADFLSDRRVLDAYLDRRIADCRDRSGTVLPGTHVVCAMTHDKFINWRMGRRWDSLDPEYGDWVTIREHLRHATERHPDVRFARPRDAVLDWYDRSSPRLLAWRDEEFVVLSEQDAETEEFAYTIRLLGRDIEVGPERPSRVRVALPAWPLGRQREAWIERDGLTWPSRRPQGVPALEFDVDSGACTWELRIRVAPGWGIRCDRRGDSTLYVSSSLAYRRASVEIPAAWSGGPRPERVRGLRLAPEAERFGGRIERVDTSGWSVAGSTTADGREGTPV